MVCDTPDAASPSPLKDTGRNPLSHFPFGTRMPLSLAQLFDAASSPRRPLAAGTSLPPTPGVAAATRLMMVGAYSDLMAPTAEEEEVTPPGSPTQPDYLFGYVTMQESQEARERARASVSPVVFGSSFVVRRETDDGDSDDGMVSAGEETRRRADRARRKGDKEVQRLFTAVKASLPGGRARSEEPGVTPKRPPRRRSRHTKSASPPDETGDEEESAPAATRPNSGVSVTTDDDDVSLPMNTTSAAAGKQPSLAPQAHYTQLLPHAWESLHRVPAATAVRRTRLIPTAPVSFVADSPPPPPPQPAQPQKTWLRSLPPFNIPAPASRPVPEFVQETSGLVPPLSSPCEEDTRKRKRSEDRVPCSVEETGMEQAACGLPSSRPEPDDVDMADAGGLDLGVTPRRTAKRVRLMQVEHARTKKPYVRKTRSSTGLRSSVAPDTPTAAVVAETDDETDILTSRNPAFSLSVSAPPPPPAAAPERVFALFRDWKTSYHPASVLESNAYTVKVAFDDGTEDQLEHAYVRALDLRLGDVVKVDIPGMKKGTWEVHGFGGPGKLPDCRGHSAVSLKPRKQGAAEPVQVPVTNIYLVKTMWKDFHARVYRSLVTTPAEPVALRSASNTPAMASRHTPLSARTFGGGGGIFAGMVFALSFGNQESVKKALATTILQNGGRIVDVGFEELFDHPSCTNAASSSSSSFSSDATTTAAAAPQHFGPRPETDRVGFVAVIANTHSRRAKFLQALALGLPCLAPRWIEDCCARARVVGWENYQLAAGDSRYLGAVRSRVLDGYDARAAQLHAVVARRAKLLDGRGVVVVAAKRACEKRV